MAIVKTDVPMTSELSHETVLALARRYPAIGVRNLTRTAFGRPLDLMTIGRGERHVIFSAAHHANEWLTATVLLRFAEELAQALEAEGRIFGVPARTLFDAATIHLVPMVDPDGVDLVTGAIEPDSPQYRQARTLADNYPAIPFPDGWKANLMGVDLNLQYPAGWLRAREIKFRQGFTRPGPRDFVGRAPLTEPEARALAELTVQMDPVVVVALHSQGEVIYWQFGSIPVPGARELGEEFARLSGYELADTPFASSFAGYKDWFIQNFRRPGYTVEVGRGENPLPLEQFDEIYRRTLGILVTAATGLPGQ